MDNLKFQKTLNEQGRVTELKIGGMLVLENAQQIKKEFVSVFDFLNDQVEIRIAEADEIDLSFIQLIVAFIRYLDQNNVTYQFHWELDEDQKSLFENVGLSNELFMTN